MSKSSWLAAILTVFVAHCARASPCGTSITPSFNYGSNTYFFECTLSANLTINNPNMIRTNYAFLFEIIQPSPEPPTHYAVMMGSAYYQQNSPSPNTLPLSTAAGVMDVFSGVGVSAYSGGKPDHVDLGLLLPNMGP